MRDFRHLLKSVEQYYSERIAVHGPVARGVDWNSEASQVLRFEQLLKVCDVSPGFSLNDYGCGYGALVDYLHSKKLIFQYHGFDISTSMIAHAHRLHGGLDGCKFFSDESLLPLADYTLASGIFNVKIQASDEEWRSYVLHTVNKIAASSRKGFAFNMLTVYSDPKRRRPDLHYADPLFWFDHCKRNFSRFVTLLHDYPLYEFTILVRKE
jgi:SAM-dependent methyltransferase